MSNKNKPKTKKSKSVVIIMVILLVAIVFFALRFKAENKGSINQNQIASNLVTYTDGQVGFSIKYSPVWELSESPQGGVPFSLLSSKYPSTLPQGDGRIFFFSEKNKEGLSLIDWVKLYGNSQGNLPSSVYSQSVLNGIPVVVIKYVWNQDFINWLRSRGLEGDYPPLGSEFREISLENGDNIIQIQTLYTDNNTIDIFYQDVDEVLFTLELIK